MKMIKQISPERIDLLPESLLPLQQYPYTLKPFDDATLRFLQAISRFVLSDPKLNKVPAFAALGFWLRQSNMNQIKAENKHLAEPSGFVVEPLGVVFHVCPSNVDTMFIYSLAISLLMGNKNVVKISGRLQSEIIDYFINGINRLLQSDEFTLFKHYMAFITYDHDAEINSFFSGNVEARILWGGDRTIATFKSFKTKPRIKDLAFADRLSAVIFKSTSFLELPEDTKAEITRKFYNDTFTFDQLGCSSPQMIFCLGNEKDNDAFLKEMYGRLHEYATRLYEQDIYSIANLKLNFMAESAMDDQVVKLIHSSNYLVFAEIADDHVQMKKTCGGGFFFVKRLSKLDSLTGFINRKVQTLSYFGLDDDEIRRIATLVYAFGIDRIVPVGQALNFDYIWDGYHLPDELSNKKKIIFKR